MKNVVWIGIWIDIQHQKCKKIIDITVNIAQKNEVVVGNVDERTDIGYPIA